MASEMLNIPAKLPKPIVKEVDAFIRQGIFSSRSELIREAVRRFIVEEAERLHPSRIYLSLLEREMVGRIRERRPEEIVEEGRKIRREVWDRG